MAIVLQWGRSDDSQFSQMRRAGHGFELPMLGPLAREIAR
jgi:hypothetical protein